MSAASGADTKRIHMASPLVSVVIPSFNRRELVFRALGSVFTQDVEPLEVIVVDDGSTDGTVEAIRGSAFGSKTVVLQLAVNGGPSAARNAGIERATGRYIAFLDSDDVWAQGKLRAQLREFDSATEPDHLVVFSQVHVLRPHEMLVRPKRGIVAAEPVADYLFANAGFIHQSAIMLPAVLAKTVRYDPRLRLHEDWDFMIRLERGGAVFRMIPQPLATWFDDADSGRASAPKPYRSLEILEQWRPVISERAYQGLRGRIAPQLRDSEPLKALSYILTAWHRGAVSTPYVIGLLGQLLHPRLRTLAYALRGRLSRRTVLGQER
jgi:glycosyltransferase involved in cell wall biosynthesis